ncbi:MAG: LPS translocon maturation chaperone LptM [Alphaproteobacteria bacterium]
MKRIILILSLTLLSACGVKKPLFLPKYDNNINKQQ